ncbi:HAMP domain-containing sensor histidine kinase [Enterococcus hulanensis]|uniref:histidine kinase n=1 Tax=Enterococcus hulanensis TaxID=2559929 RepID=A0ABU3EV46_9ENTE|nr:HAMP domain-containing sensor histidine kinase [Enterococcus hulanensis]MDT2598203.1 HAMP domain-containing sensor histidine kinase [Enterococcus hulanensis]MDT2608292.1 HAMP domain-containing sensor histidine kinase [Enterococcus hulanensis]MDT2615587.1 HAMP domain-containing sensor histidine kinase [Enterococcus hulanensis]MDT2626442.1 HAMP domain-containing sensor histidine kinase [Enterococcus hulanensis]MDT2654659.1 HAMP domain-containing sensor histidine kinase [Enterococcus hulanensi
MNFPKSNLTRAFIQRVALIFILLFLFITLFYRWGFPTYYYWKMEQPVKEAQKLIQTGHEDQIPDDLVVVAVDNQTSVSEEELTSDITFRLNQEGIALNRFWIDQTTTEAVKKGRSVQRLYSQNRQRNDFYSVFFTQGQTFYLIGTSIPDFQAAIQTLFPIVIAATVLFLGLLFGMIVLLVRKQIIEPIRRLEQTTRTISKLNFAASDVQEENELGNLSQSINQMKRSLSQHEMEMLERNDQLKAFSSNLAHELKTPLSVMQLLVDGEQLGLENPTFLADLDQQLVNMNELVVNLLNYSQQMKETIEFEKMAIKPLIKKELAQQQLIDQKFTIELEVEDCQLETNEQLMRMVLSNLLTNGMKYSLDKQMRIIGKKQGEQYQLIFVNKAAEMSHKQFSQLAEPFVVGEESRNNHLSGTGLGLSIVEQTLKLLGGELTLQQENHCFIATVVLPIEV